MSHSEVNSSIFAHPNDVKLESDWSSDCIGSPEVHAGGSHPGQEPAATQTLRSVPGCHRADQLEVRGGAAEGVPLEGDFLHFKTK